MAFEKLTNSIQELKDSVRSFAESNVEYYKLSLYKKVVKTATSLVTAVLIGFFGIFFLLFLSIAVAVHISAVLDQPSVGFYIVAGFYLLIIIFILVIGRKLIEKKFLLKSSRKIFKDKTPPDERI
ncbi:MAG: phage holin family protein [Bacteroidota bacterium]